MEFFITFFCVFSACLADEELQAEEDAVQDDQSVVLEVPLFLGSRFVHPREDVCIAACDGFEFWEVLLSAASASAAPNFHQIKNADNPQKNNTTHDTK